MLTAVSVTVSLFSLNVVLCAAQKALPISLALSVLVYRIDVEDFRGGTFLIDVNFTLNIRLPVALPLATLRVPERY